MCTVIICIYKPSTELIVNYTFFQWGNWESITSCWEERAFTVSQATPESECSMAPYLCGHGRLGGSRRVTEGQQGQMWARPVQVYCGGLLAGHSRHHRGQGESVVCTALFCKFVASLCWESQILPCVSVKSVCLWEKFWFYISVTSLSVGKSSNLRCVFQSNLFLSWWGKLEF